MEAASKINVGAESRTPNQPLCISTPTTPRSSTDASRGGEKPGYQVEPSELEANNAHVQDTTLAYNLTRRQKWFLVSLVSLAGMLSPLSSNIYFPATSSISSDLNTSLDNVALTITVYMVVQGIAPSFFAALSESVGRRTTLVASLMVYVGANLGLAFTSSFPMLLVLRGVQAAGSSATISISAGVISDVASASERGGFVGTNTGMRYCKLTTTTHNSRNEADGE